MAFPQPVMEACLKASNEVNAETSAANADFKKVWESIQAFRNDEYQWWQVAEFTYDAFMILKDAIEKEGTTNPDRIVAHIEKSEHVGTGAVATFDKRHDLVWAVGKTSGIAVQWQDGKKVPFWPPQVKGMQPFKMPAR